MVGGSGLLGPSAHQGDGGLPWGDREGVRRAVQQDAGCLPWF